MLPALKQFSYKLKITITFFVVLFALFSQAITPKDIFAQTLGSGRCVCATPSDDGCACSYTDTGGDRITTSLGEVTVYCATQELANSFFNVANPVCGNNAELLPACSRVSWDSSLLMCWGTSFSTSLGTLAGYQDTRDWVQFDQNATFNGTDYGYARQIWTCGASLYCCGGKDDEGNWYCTDPSAEYDTCPSDGGPRPGSPADEACENAAADMLWAGVGESRIWFSNARLVHVLSTMSQTMFNPRLSDNYEDEDYFLMYEDTAFSKTATQDERDTREYIGIAPLGHYVETSGRIDTRGGITSRIDRHQGLSDSTPVVDAGGGSSNNSSVIVLSQVPGALDPYYDVFKDSNNPECYIPEVFSNPGDDLIGARIKAEMLFTQSFDMQAKGRPDTSSVYKDETREADCTDDGESFEIDYEDRSYYTDADCELDCCSARCNMDAGWNLPSTCVYWGETGTIGPECLNHLCTYDHDGNLSPELYCCENFDTECHPPDTTTITCESLDDIRFSVGADAKIYNKSPLIEAIDDTILRGNDSLFRRFMPDITGIFVLEDIPTYTPVSFSATPINFGDVNMGSFNLEYADDQVTSPEMYIPHLGSLYKYWLVDFQKALKPGIYSSFYTGDTMY